MKTHGDFFVRAKHGRIALLSLTLCLVATLGLDRLTKWHAHSILLQDENPVEIREYSQIPFPVLDVGERKIGSRAFFFAIQFQYARNPGAAFSMLEDLQPNVRALFFHAVTALAVILICTYLYNIPLIYKASRLGLVMILGGAVGNYIDRLRFGYVIDFIDLDWRLFGWQHDFAIFNVADIAINFGVILIVGDFLRRSD